MCDNAAAISEEVGFVSADSCHNRLRRGVMDILDSSEPCVVAMTDNCEEDGIGIRVGLSGHDLSRRISSHHHHRRRNTDKGLTFRTCGSPNSPHRTRANQTPGSEKRSSALRESKFTRAASHDSARPRSRRVRDLSLTGLAIQISTHRTSNGEEANACRD